MVRNNLGQIWIETALYLLIGISLIALFLVFAIPKIQEYQDRVIFESSLDAMIDIDNSVSELRRRGSGNQKRLDLFVRKGRVRIEANNFETNALTDDSVVLIIERSRFAASEIKFNYFIDVSGTNLKVNTEEAGDKYNIIIKREFKNTFFNLTYSGVDKLKEFGVAPTPYGLIIKNKGRDPTTNLLNIDFDVVSS